MRKILNKHKGIFYHVCSTFFMGISPVLSKLGLESLHPLYAASLSCLITGLLTCIGIIPINSQRPFYFKPNLILIGILNGFAIGFLFIALATTAPDIVAFINRIYIVFVVCWGILILNERISFKELIFLALAMVGIFMFSYRELDWKFYQGILFSLLSALIFSFSNFYTKKILEDISHYHIMFVTNIISFFILICLGLIFIREIDPPTFHDIIFISLGAFFGGYLGLSFFYKGLKESDFHLAGAIRSFVPLITLMYSIPIFGLAPFSFFNFIGAFLLFISLLIFCILKFTRERAK